MLNPREEITIERLSELTLEVRKRVEGATEEERRYAAPPTGIDSLLI
jgi:peroxin-3